MLFVFLLGCAGGAPSRPGPSTSVTDPCTAGTGECSEDPCGAAPWGPNTDADVFVDQAAPDGGDGSVERPFRTLAEGVARGGVVAVAAGTYPERLAFGEEHDGLVIAGRCPSLVVIDAEPEGDDPVVLLDGAGSTRVDLRGLTLTGGGFGGAIVVTGTLGLTEVEVVETTTIGILAAGRSADLQATDVLVASTLPDARGDFGRGVEVDTGGSATLTRVHVEGSRDGGIWLGDAGQVSVTDCSVADTAKSDNGDGGYGFVADDSATVQVDGLSLTGSAADGLAVGGTVVRGGRVVVSDAREAGISMVSAAQLYLDDVAISDVQAQGRSTDGGWGFTVSYGSYAEVSGLRIDAATETGVLVYDAEAVLEGFAITGTLPNGSGQGGMGVYVSGGEVTLTDGEIVGNTSAGVYLVDGTASLEGVSVRETGSAAPLTGVGVSVHGATSVVSLRGGELVDNAYAGVEVFDGTASIDAVSIRGTTADVDGSGGYGALVAGGAVTLSGVLLQDNLVGGAIAAGEASTLELEETTATGGRRGFSFEQGASGAITDCEVGGVSDIGVYTSGGGRVEIDGLSVHTITPSRREDLGRALNVQEGPTVTASGLDLSGAPQTAIFVGNATLELADSQIHDGSGDASGAYGVGIVARYGASVSVADVELLRLREVGVLASDADTRVTLERVDVADTRTSARYAFAVGAVAQALGTLELTDTTIAGQAGPALYVNGGVVRGDGLGVGASGFAGVVLIAGDLTLSGGTVDADAEVGLYLRADNDARATLVDVDVGVNRYAAAWFEGPGSWQVEGGRFAAGAGSVQGAVTLHGNGLVARDVDAWDGAAGLRVEGAEIHGGPGPAVLLDHASAEIGGGTSFVSTAGDVWQQDCDGVASPPAGDLSGLDVTLCPDRWALLAPLDFWLSLLDGAPA